MPEPSHLGHVYAAVEHLQYDAIDRRAANLHGKDAEQRRDYAQKLRQCCQLRDPAKEDTVRLAHRPHPRSQ